MKIRIASLSLGFNHWQERIAPTALDLQPETYSEIVDVDIKATKSIGKIEVKVSCQTQGLFICDRCGEPFKRNVGGEYEVIFIEREKPFPDEMPGDDLRSYLINQEELDISTEIRDALILSVPMKILCQQDCRGLCPRCGANLNFEPCHCQT
ncbi:MAG: YceD family protein [bacterium]